MKFSVIVDFVDAQEHHLYRVGDTFPYNGKDVSDERIRALSTVNNAIGKPLIVIIAEPTIAAENKPETVENKQETAEKPIETVKNVVEAVEKPVKKRGRRKSTE